MFQNPARILATTVALVLFSFYSLVQGQSISLVLESGGDLEVEQGIGGTIQVSLDSDGHDDGVSLSVFGATLVVDTDLLDQGDLSFDSSGTLFGGANLSPLPYEQDLSIDFVGGGAVNGSDGHEFLVTLKFDTSSLSVGDTFSLSFTGSQVTSFSPTGLLSIPPDVQVTVVAPFLLGDVNLDGAVNFLDISPFISLLSVGGFLDEADINLDGSVNFLDISPFISILSGQ